MLESPTSSGCVHRHSALPTPAPPPTADHFPREELSWITSLHRAGLEAQASLQQMAQLIEGTLAEHGATVEVVDIKAGPRVVRFGLVPGWARRGETSSGESLEGTRVKVQSILAREKDLALAFKTPHLRIEAPVPGVAFVGLEVSSSKSKRTWDQQLLVGNSNQ